MRDAAVTVGCFATSEVEVLKGRYEALKVKAVAASSTDMKSTQKTKTTTIESITLRLQPWAAINQPLRLHGRHKKILKELMPVRVGARTPKQPLYPKFPQNVVDAPL